MKEALNVARYFIDKDYKQGKSSITQKKVQKLVFYAQAWCLVFFGRSLFQESLQAWVHGSVAPSVREEYKYYGSQVLPLAQNIELTWSSQEEKILEEVWRIYSPLSANELEELNHNEQPWQNARRGLSPEESSNNIISLDDMILYYSQFVESKEEYKISLGAVNKHKDKLVEFRLLDGSVHKIPVEKAENFIIQNLGNFEKKRFQPRRPKKV